MLARLDIENYGLIERASVEFARGATIFTGETGSGKTMLLGALGFVLGDRTAADAVRRGASKASVTLTFDPGDTLRARLAADGFELDPGEEAAIGRDVSDAGRSSMRVCGRASTAAYVRELADAIAEIVGQHEAQRLLAPAYHLELLDRSAGEAALRARTAVAAAHTRAAELRAELERAQGDESAARARYDDARFALREIEGARVEPGEDVRLTDRRRILDNAGRVAEALRRAHEALGGDESGATTSLGDAGVALAGIAAIASEFAVLAQQAAALQSDANELAAAAGRALEETEFDPAELESIVARLDELDRLKRKYGGSIESVVEHARQSRTVVDEFEGRDKRTAELSMKVVAAGRELGMAAMELTNLRKTAAAALEKRVRAEFADLALASGRFEVAFETLDHVGPGGAERAEFLFAANAGEPARALARVASGGELSRVLLALTVALANVRDPDSALVFDEIDAGIGGATAAAVGSRIGRLAANAQVISVTHLAQLATWADRHYVLDKSESEGQTTISVREISTAGDREGELARMLSGETHDAALRHARALLEGVAEARG